MNETITVRAALEKIAASDRPDNDRLIVMVPNPASYHYWTKPVGHFTVGDIRALLTAPKVDHVELADVLTMTGCRDRADLEDMANVGKSLLDAIASLVSAPGPFHGWQPMDDPAEIVTDLQNALDEALASQPQGTPPAEEVGVCDEPAGSDMAAVPSTFPPEQVDVIPRPAPISTYAEAEDDGIAADLVTRNPAPQAAPPSGPSGVFREFSGAAAAAHQGTETAPDNGLAAFIAEQERTLGTALQAIEFALSAEADDPRTFLDRWQHGDVSEWPEYATFLAAAPSPADAREGGE